MVIVRPALAVVHWAASGQVAQAGPNSALPACRAWPRTKRMATVTRLGHVTVPASRVMSNRSLVNWPAGATGACTLSLVWTPAASSRCRTSPATQTEHRHRDSTGDEAASKQWQPEQQSKCDRPSHHLGHVRGQSDQLGLEPETP